MLRSAYPAGDPLPLLRFAALGDLPHAVSTRHGGVSQGPFATLNMGLTTGDSKESVSANRRALEESLGLAPQQVMFGRFSHGNDVSVFQDVASAKSARPVGMGPRSSRSEALFCSDGVISDVPGLHFFLTFADCVPLAFRDRRRGVIGAAHAGWRGTARGIARAVVRTLGDEFGADPADLLVGIGPSIGPCCYSVDSEVLTAFNANGFDPVVLQRDGRTYLDLWTTNERQLRQAGVPAESIENTRVCTSCNRDTFYSHRAEQGRTGRFALCIGLSERGG